jgi:AraC family transcriptional activator of mtrCDE
MSSVDWLSQLLKMITVSGQLELRCAYGAPWRIALPQGAAHEIPYRVLLQGRAIFRNPQAQTTRELVGGDAVRAAG